jgi:hypothetical protein
MLGNLGKKGEVYMIPKRKRRAGKLVQFVCDEELHTLIKTASELEGVSIADWLRATTERVSKRNIKRSGLRSYDVVNDKLPQVGEEWESFPSVRAVSWEALGVTPQEALDLEIKENIYPIDYKRKAKEEE